MFVQSSLRRGKEDRESNQEKQKQKQPEVVRCGALRLSKVGNKEDRLGSCSRNN